jgi:hypothetical protein
VSTLQEIASYLPGSQYSLSGHAGPEKTVQRVCDRYFEVMQIPILRGRALGTTDRSGAVLAAVVSRRAADRLWPGRDPIGQRFRKVGPDQSTAGS